MPKFSCSVKQNETGIASIHESFGRGKLSLGKHFLFSGNRSQCVGVEGGQVEITSAFVHEFSDFGYIARLKITQLV